MGCGASVPSQGATAAPPVTTAAADADSRLSTPAPVAEEARSMPDNQPRPLRVPVPPSPAASARPSEPPTPAAATDKAATSVEPSDDEPLPGTPGAPPLFTQQGSLPHSADVYASAAEAARLVLAEGGEQPASATPRRTGGVDPPVTPSSQTATVTLLGEAAGFSGGRSRYTNESDLSMASTSYDWSGDASDDDELDALFTLQAWKRYYGYNKKKHHDLLAYFWRKFPIQDYSCFCISYRFQDLLLTPYMAENCVHGFISRVEEQGLADHLFLQMYVLHDFECDLYRIVGLLLVQGPALPQPLAALSAFDNFVYHKADTGNTLVKHFLSALLVGKSPLNSLQLLSEKEVL